MPSRKARKSGFTSKSVASIPDEFLGRKMPTAETLAELKETRTSIVDTGTSHPESQKDIQTPEARYQNATPSLGTHQPHPRTAPAITCAVCAHIGRILTCCRNLKATQDCKDCADMALLLAKVAPDPQHDRQLKEDHIESLKLETKQFEAETERLKELLQQKKKLLQEKRNELYRKKPEGPKILKRLGRMKAVKRKEK
jgi:hypothetical protein